MSVKERQKGKKRNQTRNENDRKYEKKGRDIEVNGNKRRDKKMIKIKKKEKTKKLKEMNEMRKRGYKGNVIARWIDREGERKEIRN